MRKVLAFRAPNTLRMVAQKVKELESQPCHLLQKGVNVLCRRQGTTSTSMLLFCEVYILLLTFILSPHLFLAASWKCHIQKDMWPKKSTIRLLLHFQHGFSSQEPHWGFCIDNRIKTASANSALAWRDKIFSLSKQMFMNIRTLMWIFFYNKVI